MGTTFHSGPIALANYQSVLPKNESHLYQCAFIPWKGSRPPRHFDDFAIVNNASNVLIAILVTFGFFLFHFWSSTKLSFK